MTITFHVILSNAKNLRRRSRRCLDPSMWLLCADKPAVVAISAAISHWRRKQCSYSVLLFRMTWLFDSTSAFWCTLLLHLGRADLALREPTSYTFPGEENENLCQSVIFLWYRIIIVFNSLLKASAWKSVLHCSKIYTTALKTYWRFAKKYK